MENSPDNSKKFKLIKEKNYYINEERRKNVITQIQNFVNNFEKIKKEPEDIHILTNFDNIQYQKFSMKRLSFDKNNFTQQMMMLKKTNNPENNIFILKQKGYSYKANFSLLDESNNVFGIKNLLIKNNMNSPKKLNFLKSRNNNKLEIKNNINNSEKNVSQDKEIKNETTNSITTKKESNIDLSDNNKTLNDNDKKYHPRFIISKGKTFSTNRVKKGRQNVKISYRVHTASDYDNILRKIQVHFLSFIIHFLNDIVRTFIPYNNEKLLFKNIDYKIKKDVNHKFIEKILTKNIFEVLKFDISPKYKQFQKSTNSTIAGKICEKLPFMNDFLKQNYLDLFNDYYYSKDKNFIINNTTIKITKKTEVFSELLKRNLNYEERIKNVIKNYFKCGFKRKKKRNYDLKANGNET